MNQARGGGRKKNVEGKNKEKIHAMYKKTNLCRSKCGVTGESRKRVAYFSNFTNSKVNISLLEKKIFAFDFLISNNFRVDVKFVFVDAKCQICGT